MDPNLCTHHNYFNLNLHSQSRCKFAIEQCKDHFQIFNLLQFSECFLYGNSIFIFILVVSLPTHPVVLIPHLPHQTAPVHLRDLPLHSHRKDM